MTSLEVGFFCQKCSTYTAYQVPPDNTAGTCLSCSYWNDPKPTPLVLTGGPIDLCPQCENSLLYVRKDLPQQLGCAAVTATIIFSSIAYALWDFPAALAVLVSASLIDCWLYQKLDEVTVCYRCHTELRGFVDNPTHKPFDMHRAEEFEQGT